MADKQGSLSLLCWNIRNPAPERAKRQAEWLSAQAVDVMVLTEAKASQGCRLLAMFFRERGYTVLFGVPAGNEYAAMLVSGIPLSENDVATQVGFLAERAVSATFPTVLGPLELTGVYVPSRDRSDAKRERKRRFMDAVSDTLATAPHRHRRIFCGDFNILEPDHIPRYSVYEAWEYAFYRRLSSFDLHDAFRHLHPTLVEHSWAGRTGNGYRYDHIFISADLLAFLHECRYDHEPRHARLSDHSAMLLQLRMPGGRSDDGPESDH